MCFFLKTRRHQVASDLSYDPFGRLAPSELVYLRTAVGVLLFCSLIMFQRADADYGFSKSSIIGAAERAADKLSDGRDWSPWYRPELSCWLSSDPAGFSSRLGPTQLLDVLARGWEVCLFSAVCRTAGSLLVSDRKQDATSSP